MSMNVGNCPRCGKVYVLNLSEVCPACIKNFELMYDKCLKYLRDNRGTTLSQLSEATEVSVNQIAKLIREGRISIQGRPNMTYPCELCGAEIRDKSMCESCRLKLVKDVANNKEDEQRDDALRKAENKISFKISDRLKDR